MKVHVEITCPFCGAEHFVIVEENHYLDWKSGALAQDAMPELSATEREQLISGLCPKCQEKIFG